MDSPLNLAHQHARRAEMMMKSGKIDEAVASHIRTAENILLAMQTTSSEHALESMKLQHRYHLKQTDLLYERQRRIEILQIQRTKTAQRNQVVQTDIQGPVISLKLESNQQTIPVNPSLLGPSFPSSVKKGDNGPLNISGQSIPCGSSNFDDNSVYRTISGTDSLLGYLIRRRQNPDGQDLNSFHSGVPVERVHFSKQLPNQSKEEEEITLSLIKNNEDLKKHVQHLLKEVDELSKDKQILTEKLKQLESSNQYDLEALLADIPDGPLLLPSLELPPLQNPQFDFDKFNAISYSTRNDDPFQL
ncbi:hypothetical protein CHS0354_041045 [Potamilus streckersoni]|uniref:Nuclear receptor-binding factor 2 MIT domain-containing protein n=1 Tax=Potamilus streckersoni TaxID=2493646 RepID=A0AAE0SEW2_9BIVA|nr:hypothetical protein CHS0354_041045 [Potamilus streckersoni]